MHSAGLWGALLVGAAAMSLTAERAAAQQQRPHVDAERCLALRRRRASPTHQLPLILPALLVLALNVGQILNRREHVEAQLAQLQSERRRAERGLRERPARTCVVPLSVACCMSRAMTKMTCILPSFRLQLQECI